MTERFTRTNEVDSTKSRLMDGVIGFITIPEFSLIGAGVGMGVDAAHVGSTDSNSFTYDLSEIDVIRNVMELGTPIGFLYVLTRIGFLVGMIFFAIYLVRNGLFLARSSPLLSSFLHRPTRGTLPAMAL